VVSVASSAVAVHADSEIDRQTRAMPTPCTTAQVAAKSAIVTLSTPRDGSAGNATVTSNT
jgi:hypothetical protein